MKVLIVDNSSESLQALTEIIVTAGHNVITAVTGKAALSIFEKAQPDFVMLDTSLPDIDPVGVLGTLRVMAGDDWIPLALLHAGVDERKSNAWLEAGANLLIAKPCDARQIRAHLTLLQHVTDLRQRVLVLSRERDELHAELRSMSLRDSLTGVGNRRYFDEELSREWNRAYRNGQSLAVLLVDIDGFTVYNEKQSSLAGDDCLLRVATALAGTLRRAGDLLARYGNDEFALILPNTDSDGAKHIAVRLGDAVAGLGLPTGEPKPNDCMSVSIGLVCEKPGPASSLAHLTRAAQEALLQAKAAGRGEIFSLVLPNTST